MMNKLIELSESLDSLEEKLVQQLRNLDFKEVSIENYRININHIRKFLSSAGFKEYSEAAGELWLEKIQRVNIPHQSLISSRTTVYRLNDVLNGRKYQISHRNTSYPVPCEFNEINSEYIAYLNRRQLATKSVKQKTHYASCFFNNLVKLGCLSVDAITGEIITKASIMEDSIMYPATIRDVLKFMLEEKRIPYDLSPLVRKARRKRPIPSVYSKEELQAIKDAININTVIGKRNKAILLLAIHNGLRAGNIVGLRLSEVDFEHDLIHTVQVKTHEKINPCLLPDVKRALIDYIVNARPNTDSDYVFIRSRAPYTNMNPGDVYYIVKSAIKKAGVEPNGRKRGPHSMRSSLDSAGVNNGMTYAEMRIINGHTDANAIKHYARLDDVRLRECALEVHEPTGFFADFLKGKVTITFP